MNKIPLIVIMGATGSGKSSLAMDLSRKLPIQIISTDSMQVYREMDIGTAKPSLMDREKVSHYMIDILDIKNRIDIYYYVENAKNAINKILSKNRVPVLVGGSGLYIKSILYGLDPLPSNPELRLQLLEKFEGKDNELKELMRDKDPFAYRKFNENPRKLLRALEVFYLTGKSITLQQSEWGKKELRYNVLSYNVKLEHPMLFEKISERAEKMLYSGWIEEAEKLINKGLFNTPTAWQAIGYSIIRDFLKHKISYDEMKKKIITATKKYARRQETWFKHQHPEAEIIDISEKSKNKIIADFVKVSKQLKYGFSV